MQACPCCIHAQHCIHFGYLDQSLDAETSVLLQHKLRVRGDSFSRQTNWTGQRKLSSWSSS